MLRKYSWVLICFSDERGQRTFSNLHHIFVWSLSNRGKERVKQTVLQVLKGLKYIICLSPTLGPTHFKTDFQPSIPKVIIKLSKSQHCNKRSKYAFYDHNFIRILEIQYINGDFFTYTRGIWSWALFHRYISYSILKFIVKKAHIIFTWYAQVNSVCIEGETTN